MEKFNTVISTAVPILEENIDTDQIIPSRFLKISNRKEYGKNLFIDWKKKDKNFILNNSKFSGKILLLGKNFGCGSSREHAAWAIFDYGFRVLISSSFADIFKENAFNNGLLIIELCQNFLKKLFFLVKNNSKTKIKIDLINQKVFILKTKEEEKFYIHPYRKKCFINGYDDIDFLLSLKKDIEFFEKNRIFNL
ncbi:3-isopropylmalate dehydratase small subunit [Blattabacterium cuenoti]|uniref:3-isopropylmalate dehydratase small subunit n=1 Tax=Blattabacterium cuenoti TaxID=1653831 RepID=UPI00163B643C|nr:3-isopropylmalate dehydratase small subunit [Blattabacterium cuenoti]